jgi:peptidoglycan/LPS O-acetylase OafA/YrhL
VDRSETPRSKTPRDGHWPALDGLRAIAVLAVIGIHVGVLPGGYLGVDVFFVLSGFLITSLLIGEWDRRGSISFRDFYARRGLRLLPALACVLAAAAILAAVLELVRPRADHTFGIATWTAIPWVIAFASNFDQAAHPGALPLGALPHTWSLAVEEQFYLLWPALFLLLMRHGTRRGPLALLLAGLAVADMAYRAVLAHMGFPHDRVYYSTDSHCDGLLLGCALAFWLASGQAFRLRRAAAGLVRAGCWAGAAILAALFLVGSLPDSTVEIDVAVLATAMLVIGILLGQVPRPIERVLTVRQIVALGWRSYALYLWHDLLLGAGLALVVPYTGLFPAATAPRLLFASVIAVAIAASFVLAGLSYRYVERPALRRKRRFSSGDLSAAVASAVPAPVRPDPGTRFAS